MPSSTQRHRVEIDRQLYQSLVELATREGYPVSRFTDKLLHLAVQDYIKARKRGRYPFAGDGLQQTTNEAWAHTGELADQAAGDQATQLADQAAQLADQAASNQDAGVPAASHRQQRTARFPDTGRSTQQNSTEPTGTARHHPHAPHYPSHNLGQHDA